MPVNRQNKEYYSSYSLVAVRDEFAGIISRMRSNTFEWQVRYGRQLKEYNSKISAGVRVF